jgi:hypothetical protein
VAELTFAQSVRRNYTAPIIVAVVILGIAGGILHGLMPQRTMALKVTRETVYPIRVAAERPQASGFKVLGPPVSSEQGVYVVTTLHIDNKLNVPLFLKDFTATVTLPNGEMHTSAIEKQDLDTVYSAFPDLRSLMATPLLRETAVDPGKTSDGTLLLQFPMRQSDWNQRQSATLTIDFYHQPSVTVPIPKP